MLWRRSRWRRHFVRRAVAERPEKRISARAHAAPLLAGVLVGQQVDATWPANGCLVVAPHALSTYPNAWCVSGSSGAAAVAVRASASASSRRLRAASTRAWPRWRGRCPGRCQQFRETPPRPRRTAHRPARVAVESQDLRVVRIRRGRGSTPTPTPAGTRATRATISPPRTAFSARRASSTGTARRKASIESR